MAYETLTLDVNAHVATVTLNRPDALNTMNRAFWQEMVDVLTEIDETAAVRAVVLASTGKHFTAGIDLNDLGNVVLASEGDEGRKREQLRRLVLELQESFNALERCRAPVLAAVHGGCIGGGIDMITAADMRYCTENAFFCIHEINVGMTADVGTLQRLPHLIPSGVARELAYTGRRMYAEEAKAVGLVNMVYPDQAAMLDAVQAIAAEIAAKSPLAVTGTKEMLNYTRDHTVADALNYIATWNAGMLMSDDLGEAIAAQQQKRDAGFADLLPPKRMVRRRA